MFRLYDSATAEVRELRLRKPGEVGIYLCGPTVYGPPHLGHGRATLVYDKGTGIAMICTFGDVTDVIWWRELDLPTRAIVDANGRIKADAPAVIAEEAGQAAYAQIAGAGCAGRPAGSLAGPAPRSWCTSSTSPPTAPGCATSART